MQYTYICKYLGIRVVDNVVYIEAWVYKLYTNTYPASNTKKVGICLAILCSAAESVSNHHLELLLSTSRSIRWDQTRNTHPGGASTLPQLHQQTNHLRIWSTRCSPPPYQLPMELTRINSIISYRISYKLNWWKELYMFEHQDVLHKETAHVEAERLIRRGLIINFA